MRVNRMSTEWKALRHGPVEQLSENVWRVQGSLPNMALKRVMAVARMSTGELVIHSAIALDEAHQQELERLGPIAYLIVPNAYHRLDAPAYKARYPNIRVFCPAGGRKGVEKVVAVDGTYEDFPHDPIVRLQTLEGTAAAEGAMIVTEAGGETTLVLNDVVFNMPHGSGFPGFIFRHVTASSGGPKVSRLARMFIARDKRALRAHLERLAGLEGLSRIVVSHHEVISDAPAEVLARVAATL
jgi:hypothetical protein